jgi:hypothetical protein
MSSYVPASLRRLVAARSDGVCEYCLIADEDTFFGCQIEHIISEKHRGATVEENLAHACAFCNSHKGTDIASISTRTGQLVRLFNPRTDRWATHFKIGSDGVTIEPLTDVGEATARLLELNHPDRLLERQALLKVGRYPAPGAIRWMNG